MVVRKVIANKKQVETIPETISAPAAVPETISTPVVVAEKKPRPPRKMKSVTKEPEIQIVAESKIAEVKVEEKQAPEVQKPKRDRGFKNTREQIKKMSEMRADIKSVLSTIKDFEALEELHKSFMSISPVGKSGDGEAISEECLECEPCNHPGDVCSICPPCPH